MLSSISKELFPHAINTKKIEKFFVFFFFLGCSVFEIHLSTQTRPFSSPLDHMRPVATVLAGLGTEASFWNPPASGTVLDPKSIWILKGSEEFFMAAATEHPEAKGNAMRWDTSIHSPRAGVGRLAGAPW